MQFHLQVSPTAFPRFWNAAQSIAGVQVALGANSPFLLGKELWRETRIPLFEQATDTRLGGAEGAGRAAAGVVRRALDQLDLRPVRGERPLLPGAAAAVRPGGPGRGPRARRRAAAGRADAAQRHHLPLEPAGLRGGPRQAAPAGGEPGAAGRPDGRRHHGQRRLLLRPRARARRRRPSAVEPDVVRRGRGELPRLRPARPGRGRLLARRRPGAGDRAGAAPAAAAGRRGAGQVGGGPGGPGPAARHHRAALPDRAERRDLAGPDLPPAVRRDHRWTATTCCAG